MHVLLSYLHRYNIIFLLACAIGLLALSFASIKWGIADIKAKKAMLYLHQSYHMEDESRKVNMVTLEMAHHAAEMAVYLDPNHPSHYELMAQITTDQLLAEELDKGYEKWEPLMKEARASLYATVLLRPASPYTWRKLLLFKHFSDQYDEEFQKALERSAYLGPWELPVIQAILLSGITRWSLLTEKEKDLVDIAIRNGLEKKPDVIKPFLGRFEGWSEICDYAKGTELENIYCMP